MNFNIFHILGDVSHTVSKLILIWAIHSNSSAEGVSLITQVLYTLVFCTRYLNIFYTSPSKDWEHRWNFSLKIFYTLSSLYIIFLMTSVYARTREREKAWKFGLYCLAGSIIIAPFWFLIFQKWIIYRNVIEGILWTFSEILESVSITPQLLLLRQTTVPTVLDSYYLVTLGAYRFLYVLNWIVRGINEKHIDPTSWVWGTLQTALIVDFAWVYYTRQRVKLRHGGVVDSEDLGRGWLLGRFVRKERDFGFDAEEESLHGNSRRGGGGAAGGVNDAEAGRNQWGRRGISVSADEGVEGAPPRRTGLQRGGNLDPEQQPLADPAAFEDESDDEDAPPAVQRGQQSKGHESGVRGGDEWTDDLDEDATVHDGGVR